MTTTGPQVLSYATHARSWTEALPLGNGRLGAMVYGPVPGDPGAPVADRWQINDDTCWSGWPGSTRGVPASDEPSPAVVQRVRAALLDGDVTTAEQEIRSVQHGHSQAYQPLAELEVKLSGLPPVTLVQRRLELSTATAAWTATGAAGTASGEVFASAPARAIIGRYGWEQPITAALVVRLVTDGTVDHDQTDPDHDQLVVTGARELTIVVTTETDFVDATTAPHGDVTRLIEPATDRADQIAARSVDDLCQEHTPRSTGRGSTGSSWCSAMPPTRTTAPAPTPTTRTPTRCWPGLRPATSRRSWRR